jgi:hypothetical protein
MQITLINVKKQAKRKAVKAVKQVNWFIAVFGVEAANGQQLLNLN